MKDRLNAYIQGLFTEAERRSPANGRLSELKEELLQNTGEKYDDLIAMGKTPEAAYRAAVEGIGDISELLNDVIGENAAPAEHPAAVGQRQEAHREENAGTAEKKAASNEKNDGDGDSTDDSADGSADGADGKAPDRPPRSRWYALVSGIIWTAVLCAYFSVSFATHAWSVTWLIFIMGIAADNVAKGIFDLRR